MPRYSLTDVVKQTVKDVNGRQNMPAVVSSVNSDTVDVRLGQTLLRGIRVAGDVNSLSPGKSVTIIYTSSGPVALVASAQEAMSGVSQSFADSGAGGGSVPGDAVTRAELSAILASYALATHTHNFAWLEAAGGKIANLTIKPAAIFSGAGNFGNADTPFFVDDDGRLSLKDKLTWDGTTLSVNGTIVASSGTLGGFTIGADSLTTTLAGFHSAGYSEGAELLLGHATAYASAKIGLKADGSGKLASGNIAWDTSGNITLAGALTSSATITGGTVQTAASGARVVLNSAGIKAYDAASQRAAILSDGSGWLGSSSVFSWTSAGVVSLNGSAVMPNTIVGGALNVTNVPLINGLTITNNSPSAGYVAWGAFTLTYQGVNYSVAAGNSNLKYIWWNKATSTTVLQASNTLPANANDQFLIVVNTSGTGRQSLFQNFIYADYISVTNLQALNTNTGSLTVDGTLNVGTSGVIRSGATAALTGNGYWLEYNAGTPLFRVGTVSAGVLTKGVYWDGSNFQIAATNFTLDSSGNITSGAGATITAGTLRTAASGARTEMHGSNLFGLGFGGIGGTDGTTTQWYASATDGKLYAGGGRAVIDSNGITVPANNVTGLRFARDDLGKRISFAADQNTGRMNVTNAGSMAEFRYIDFSLTMYANSSGAVRSTLTKDGNATFNGVLNVGTAYVTGDGNVGLSGSIKQSTALAVRAYRTTTQTIGNATWTAIGFDAEGLDNDTMHDPATNSRLTATTAGVYIMGGYFQWQAFGGNCQTYIGLRKNGTTYLALQSNVRIFDAVGVSITHLVSMAAGDYIEVMAYQNSGGNATIDAGAGYYPVGWMVRMV